MVKKNPFKKDKFEERLLNEINGLLRTVIRDPRLQFVSITKVELSPDYSYATLFWDTFNASTRGDAKKTLEEAKGKLRSELAKVMEVRHVPTLTFIYDNQFEEEQKITKLLVKTDDDESH
jgi:ribosome-binding factor A